MTENKYILYTSDPIDEWNDFTHIKDVGNIILDFIRNFPDCDFTYRDVWHSILDKIVWSLAICQQVDKDLRSPDIYIDLRLTREGFRSSVLLKSENNGTVNLIFDNMYNSHIKVKEIPHENDGIWERQN